MSGLNWELFGLIEQFPTENNSEVLDQLRKGCRDAGSLGVRRGSVGICLALPSSLHLETEATQHVDQGPGLCSLAQTWRSCCRSWLPHMPRPLGLVSLVWSLGHCLICFSSYATEYHSPPCPLQSPPITTPLTLCLLP